MYGRLPRPLRIGDTGRAIFFQFICLTQKLENIFQKNIPILCKISQSKYLIRISICLVVFEVCPKICQNESFQHFPLPRNNTKMRQMKVIMIILGISPRAYILAIFLHVSPYLCAIRQVIYKR